MTRMLLLVAVTIVALSAAALSRWQFRRLAARQAANAVLLAARALPPIDLSDARPSGESLDGRRLVARGRFDGNSQVLIRGRVERAAPGLHVLTPLVLVPSGQALWVLRGFVASADATTPPADIAPPDTGVVTLEGVGTSIPERPDSGFPLKRGETTTWARADRRPLQQLRPGSLDVLLLPQSDSGSTGTLEQVPIPELTDGPHLSYAIQWIGIALAALVFGVLMVWRDGRGRAPRPAAP